MSVRVTVFICSCTLHDTTQYVQKNQFLLAFDFLDFSLVSHYTSDICNTE